MIVFCVRDFSFKYSIYKLRINLMYHKDIIFKNRLSKKNINFICHNEM